MSRKPLWKITFAVSREAEEAVMDLFADLFGSPAASYTDFETGRVTVTSFFQRRAIFSRAKRAALDAGLKRIRAGGLGLGRTRAVVVKVPAEDWAESWKRHFRPIEIGSVLLLKPSWSRRRPKKRITRERRGEILARRHRRKRNAGGHQRELRSDRNARTIFAWGNCAGTRRRAHARFFSQFTRADRGRPGAWDGRFRYLTR